MSPKLTIYIGRGVAFLSVVFLALAYRFPYWWVIFMCVALWLAFLLSYEFFVLQKVAPSNVLLHVSTFVAFLCMMYIMHGIKIHKVPVVQLLFLIAEFALMSLLLTERPLVSQFHYLFKPLRRVKTMTALFDIFAVATFMYALHVLLQIPFWPTILVSSLITGVYFVFIWRMYFAVEVKSFILWALLCSFLMLQFGFVLRFLPFGYLVYGFFYAWVAYIIQLILRFELSKKGLDIKRQVPFFVANAFLFVVTLVFYVAWV
ncbi:hypothetical protein H6758_02150 [Candidatus Nomurabacteria bacterium]|nr:hypothetical protein [Candidatus Nomurabacteria bacterium]